MKFLIKSINLNPSLNRKETGKMGKIRIAFKELLTCINVLSGRETLMPKSRTLEMLREIEITYLIISLNK